MPVRRTRDFKLRYTTDLFYQKIIVQRTFVDRDNGTILTPITQSFLDRVINNDDFLDPLENTEARNIETCFLNANNLSGQSIFNVIIPYNPDEFGHKQQIQEIESFPGVITLTYFGEKYTGNILDKL